MFQIDVASAAAALPAPAAAGTPGFFTEGNPVTGQPATVVSGDFLNMVMLELLAVLTAANIAPAKGTNNQLLAAIQTLVASANFATTGHVSITVGAAALTINWGNGVHTDNTGAQPVVFDKAFANACLASLASNNAGGAPTAFHGTNGGSKTGMTVYSSSSTGVASGSGTAFRYIAIGY